jgi:hypothetical protein
MFYLIDLLRLVAMTNFNVCQILKINTCIWVIGDGVLEFKRNFSRLQSVMTHIQWAKLIGTKI